MITAQTKRLATRAYRRLNTITNLFTTECVLIGQVRDLELFNGLSYVQTRQAKGLNSSLNKTDRIAAGAQPAPRQYDDDLSQAKPSQWMLINYDLLSQFAIDAHREF